MLLFLCDREISIGTLSLMHPFSGSIQKRPFFSYVSPVTASGGKDKSMYFDAVEFGKRVRGLRKAARMTQEELAEKLGIDKQHISRMENGARVCSIDLLLELSVVLHASTDYMLMGKESNKELTKNQLLSVISQLSLIAQTM